MYDFRPEGLIVVRRLQLVQNKATFIINTYLRINRSNVTVSRFLSDCVIFALISSHRLEQYARDEPRVPAPASRAVRKT